MLELRSKIDPNIETLNELHEREAEAKKRKNSTSWWNPGGWIGNKTPDDAPEEVKVDIRKLQREAEDRVHRLAKQREEAKAAKEAAKEHEKKGIIEKALEKRPPAGDNKANGEIEADNKALPARVDAVEASSRGR